MEEKSKFSVSICQEISRSVWIELNILAQPTGFVEAYGKIILQKRYSRERTLLA